MKFKSDRQRKAVMCQMMQNQIRRINAPPFKSSNRLPVTLSIIVPSTKKFSKPLTNDEFKTRIESEKRWFDKRFGGDTAVKEVGSYLMDGKKLIPERGMIVESATTTEKYNRYKTPFARHIEKRRKEWGQDTVAVRVEGQMFIVPKKKYIDTEKCPDEKVMVT